MLHIDCRGRETVQEALALFGPRTNGTRKAKERSGST